MDIENAGAFIYPDRLTDEVVLGWDSDISIVGNNVVLDGQIFPGGPGYGKVHIEVPLDKFKNCYVLYLDGVNSDNYDEVERILNENGWYVD